MRFGILEYHHMHIGEFINQMLDMGHEFIGICDTDSDMARRAADKYGVPLIGDIDRFFALKPQVVGTSAINSEKIDVVKICRAHKVHVMADKPIVTNMDDYNKLEKVVKEGVIQIGLMLTERFNAPIYTLYRMVQEGRLGNLISMSFLKPHKLDADKRPAWHFSQKQNGGIVIDLLVHDFDLLHWFSGSETEDICGYVKKSAYPQYPDFYDSVHMQAKTKNGVIATLEADWWIPNTYWTWGDGRIFCVGTKGRAEIKTVGDWIAPKRPYGIWVSDENGSEFFNMRMPPVTLAQDFLNRIDGKSDVVVSAKDILSASYATLIADQKAIKVTN